MASVYLDTSALIKLYVEEEGTAQVMALTEDLDGVQIVILEHHPDRVSIGGTPERA